MKHCRPHILVVVALAIVQFSGLHGGLLNALTDFRFGWTSRQATRDVVVVAIDSYSIEKIGVWPWPRRLHAELLRQLEIAGAQDVAFDVDFSAESDPASDHAFFEALQKAGGSTVLPSFKQLATSAQNGALTHVNRPLERFRDHSWSAVVNVTVERDGLVRRYPFGETLDGQFQPSMGAVLAGKYTEKGAPFLIDFGIRAASIPVISYTDALRGDETTLKAIKGKKVIVGGTAIELGDRLSVPNGGVLSGPLLQSLATESILQNRVLRTTSAVVTLIGLCAISLLMVFSWQRIGGGLKVLVLSGLAFGVEAIGLLLQAELPIVLDTSLIQVAIAAYLLAVALDEIDFRGLLSRIAERRFQRIAMSLGDGLVCADTNLVVTVWNPGAVSIFGYKPEEILGRRFEAICALIDPSSGDSFSFLSVPENLLQSPGGKVVELQGRHKDGTLFPVEACLSGWNGADGFQYGAVLRDISIRKREAERIRYLAEYDALTGLANRHLLHEYLVEQLSEPSSKIALLIVGLDKFQHINDMWGHSCGDLILCAVAQRLKTEIGQDGFVARLGGDEFGVVIRNENIAQAIWEISLKITNSFDRPFLAGLRPHYVKASIGSAIAPVDGETADDLLGNSHLALCRAKATARGSHLQFEHAFRHEIESRLTLEAELTNAAQQNEFELFYQPQVRLIDGSLVGAEALIRWRHPTRGIISPAEFMPIINASAISDQVAAWVLTTACAQARGWEIAGHCLRIGVNLSPSQLRSDVLVNLVRDTLFETGLTPSLLELEVTEDILISDAQKARDIFNRLQGLGVRVVFDDFGTGYASLTYLKQFSLDGLKIDRAFVLGLSADSADAAIVDATIGLSKKLGLSVIAEGIENRETASLLLRMGCEEGQGYFYGRPMQANTFETKFLSCQSPGIAQKSFLGEFEDVEFS